MTGKNEDKASLIVECKNKDEAIKLGKSLLDLGITHFWISVPLKYLKLELPQKGKEKEVVKK